MKMVDKTNITCLVILAVSLISIETKSVLELDDVTVAVDDKFHKTIGDQMFLLKYRIHRIVDKRTKSLPDWLTFDNSTNLLYGIPQMEDTGTYAIRIKATCIEPSKMECQEKISRTFIIRVVEPIKSADSRGRDYYRLHAWSGKHHGKYSLNLTNHVVTPQQTYTLMPSSKLYLHESNGIYTSQTVDGSSLHFVHDNNANSIVYSFIVSPCGPETPSFYASLLLHVKHELTNADLFSIVLSLSAFVSKPLRLISLSRTVKDVLSMQRDNKHIITAGPGNVVGSLKESLELSWHLACDEFKHAAQFGKILQHNIDFGRLTRELGRDIIAWYLYSDRPVSRRLKRNANVRNGGTRTPTLSIVPSSMSFEVSSLSIDFTEQSTLVISSTVTSSSAFNIVSDLSDLSFSSFSSTSSMLEMDLSSALFSLSPSPVVSSESDSHTTKTSYPSAAGTSQTSSTSIVFSEVVATSTSYEPSIEVTTSQSNLSSVMLNLSEIVSQLPVTSSKTSYSLITSLPISSTEFTISHSMSSLSSISTVLLSLSTLQSTRTIGSSDLSSIALDSLSVTSTLVQESLSIEKSSPKSLYSSSTTLQFSDSSTDFTSSLSLSEKVTSMTSVLSVKDVLSSSSVDSTELVLISLNSSLVSENIPMTSLVSSADMSILTSRIDSVSSLVITSTTLSKMDSFVPTFTSSADKMSTFEIKTSFPSDLLSSGDISLSSFMFPASSSLSPYSDLAKSSTFESNESTFNTLLTIYPSVSVIRSDMTTSMQTFISPFSTAQFTSTSEDTKSSVLSLETSPTTTVTFQSDQKLSGFESLSSSNLFPTFTESSIQSFMSTESAFASSQAQSSFIEMSSSSVYELSSFHFSTYLTTSVSLESSSIRISPTKSFSSTVTLFSLESSLKVLNATSSSLKLMPSMTLMSSTMDKSSSSSIDISTTKSPVIKSSSTIDFKMSDAPSESSMSLTSSFQETMKTPSESSITLTSSIQDTMKTPSESSMTLTSSIQETMETPSESSMTLTSSFQETMKTPSESSMTLTSSIQVTIETPSESSMTLTFSIKDTMKTPSESSMTLTSSIQDNMKTPSESSMTLTSSIQETMESSKVLMSSSLVVPTVPTDDTPVLQNSIDHLPIVFGKYFMYRIPVNTFNDTEDGNTRNLTLSISLLYSKPIPVGVWLKFNATSQTLYGIPLQQDFKDNEDSFVERIVLIAEDSQKQVARDVISLTYSFEVLDITHVISLTLDFRFEHFHLERQNLVDVAELLAQFYGNTNFKYLTFFDVKPGSVVVRWGNNSLFGTICYKDIIGGLFSKMAGENGTLTVEFENLLTMFNPISAKLELSGPCLLPQVTPLPPFDSPVGASDNDKMWIEILLPALVVILILVIIALVLLICCRHRKPSKEPKSDKPAFLEDRQPIIFPEELEMVDPSLKPKQPLILPRDYLTETPPAVPPHALQDLPSYRVPEINEDLFKPRSSETPPPPSYGNQATSEPPPYRLPPPYFNPHRANVKV